MDEAPRIPIHDTAGFDKPTENRPVQMCTGDHVALRVPAELMSRLRRVTGEANSPFLVAVSGWAMLLARWCGQDEIVLEVTGVPKRACSPDETSGTFSLDVSLQDDPDALQVLSQVTSALARSAPPLEIWDHVEERVALEHALTQTRLVLAPGPLQAWTGTLTAIGEGAGRDVLERLVDSWLLLLEGVAENPGQSSSRLPLLTPAARAEMLRRFNRAQRHPAPELLIHELFEQQVERVPDEIALMCGEQKLTFAELNRRANQLAWYLRDQGVAPDQIVALCVERSISMVVGMLGVLKAGGAYVPLDPAYPADRLRYMLQDARPRVLLTQGHLRNVLPAPANELVDLDQDWPKIARCADGNIPRRTLGLNARNLAFVIYTSGSTGAPKGAMNEHRGMINRILAQRDIERFDDTDICCQKTSISFVDAVFEIFGALCSGRPLVIIPRAVMNDSRAMATLIARERVTRLVTVPSLARSMLDDAQVMRDLIGLRSWTLSGEEVQPDLLMKLHERLPDCEWIIQYGSSEVSSDATIFKCRDLRDRRVPIGKPLPNVHVYVLDRHGEPVPVGVPGEIYVGGVGVGRGYLHRPDLTKTRFVQDPFGDEPDERLYRMGDLGRWRADGLLEYLGRNDNQVKIRGFRIELGEVESRLLQVRQVREAAVVTREDVPGDNRLVAYVALCISDGRESSPQIGESATISAAGVLSNAECAAMVDALRSHLKSVLPEYMVPAAFVAMPALPRTPNGKLDRRALPAPGLDAYCSRPYQPPQNEIEATIVRAWQQLLGVERVSRLDNFFELGGHSLLIPRMLETLRRAGLTVDVTGIYASATLADLAGSVQRLAPMERADVPPPRLVPSECHRITPEMLTLIALDSHQIERIVQQVPGGAANIRDIYPLAPLQAGIFFHSLMTHETGDTYVRPVLLRVATRAALDRLLRALQALIDRHDVLRTAVLWDELPVPVQVVYRRATLLVEELEMNATGTTVEQLRERMRSEHCRLNLRRAPLMRLQIAIDAHDGSWYAVLQTHHLIFDDESLRIMVAELRACMEGRNDSLPPPAPYRDHVARALACSRDGDAEQFFRRKLGDITEPTVPFGLLHTHGQVVHLDEAHATVEHSLAGRVRSLGRSLGVSAATLFHAAWGLVVSRTSGREDIVYGSVLLGRMKEGATGAERPLGMYINTLPLRLQLRGLTARELVDQTHRSLIELFAHEQASLAEAQRRSGVGGSLPLFTALLNYLHGTRAESAEPQWITSEVEVLASRDRSNYPIVISVEDQGEGFALTAQTDNRVRPERVLGYMLTALGSLAHALERAQYTPVSALSILPHSERVQILESFNATLAHYAQDKLAHDLFEEQVRRTPDAVAAICGDEKISYAELNKRANQLAHALIECGVRADDRVAVFIERGTLLVTALLATLKAGAAYVPLDVSYPVERLAYMLSESAPVAVLTQRHLAATLAPCTAQVLVVDGDDERISRAPVANPNRKVTPDHLAYVIYTSGSTGTPKGAMIEHRGLANIIHWHCEAFDVRPGSRASCLAAVGFDASSWEIWPVLCAGATLHIAPSELSGDPGALLSWWAKQPIDVSFLTTPIAELAFTRGVRNPTLRILLTGGDRLHFLPPAQTFDLVNNYGPTETTIVATSGPVRRDDPVLHIGRPIANTRIYILDQYGEPAPIGVAGEIHIAGAGVGRGYLGRPELTAERFVCKPLRTGSSERLYNTGDIGRWHENGTIEYLGRNDGQVKIRGFRIELGEIETQLTRHDQVKEAAVLAREDALGQIRLVAYVVPNTLSATREGPRPDVLRAHLSASLPHYMVPSAFVMLERLPLTPNGKVDRRALPVPDVTAYASQAYEAPVGEVEEVLAEIWRDLLGVERVGRHDNFFELGGHSLFATRAMSRIRERLEVELPLKVLFSAPTLEQLATRVTAEREEQAAEESMRADQLARALRQQIEDMGPESVRARIAQLEREVDMAGEHAHGGG